MTGGGSDDLEQPAAAVMEPAAIDVARQVGVTLTWADGHRAQFGLVDLRVNCPCAACREQRLAGQTVWPQPGSPETLWMLDARLVGAFGIGFDWNDGHSTGIYTWDLLRRWSSSSGD